ncbi:MAG TPA: PQQ-binding-like beta-propeller repeat protein [Candidatus Limnocylindrales bacterium]|nr:PQQ-binding-like beta-propeller repeat protein [Candidatus Limnocylindrales bacterium]
MYLFGFFPLKQAHVFCFSLLLAVSLAHGIDNANANRASSPNNGSGYNLFAHTNLAAWCIVPFDGKKRGPEARAEMLERLGFTYFAYDYRAEHIPMFDTEMDALQRHHIRLLAWWFPTELNDEARLILDVLKRHQLRGVQLWVMGGGETTRNENEQTARVENEANRIERIARAANPLNCTVGLYNHGGWFGEPENQIAIIERLRSRGITNVGIVYNQHHGQQHIDRFPELLQTMKPYLLALNLNGMNPGAHDQILPIGQGQVDLKLLQLIRVSGWTGPIGILNHTDEDAEARLQDNRAGLDWVSSRLDSETNIPRPIPGSWKPESRAQIDYWAVEDAAAREKLPLYKVIPAAAPDELTLANGCPKRETFLTWHRSHGDNGGTRYSALDQINRQNVTNLQVAWTYHSLDASNNIQCNPIIVKGVMFAPTPAQFIVAVNAETGVELWRFRPEGRPAFRGLIYWSGETNAPERVLFCAGKYLYALDPKTGRPVTEFGTEGKTLLPGRAQGDFGAATAAPAIFRHVIVVPGFEKDVWGFDVVTGQQLWTFHTVPHEGEYGYETWDRPEDYAANCWAGMAMDEVRGIAYITTGSPKPNFIGVGHRGDNLFANCVIALDAASGKRLWHFQEIHHDIWDLDISAPPNLATITRNGKKVDVVAAVTKVGNTLLLDRVSGKPIFPFRLRRAPASTLRGEVTAPYQPDLELPERFSKQEYSVDDLTDRTEEAADFAQTRFKSADTGFFQPCREGRPNLYMGIDGGAEWTGACIDPETGRLYVSANHMGWIISLFRNDDPPPDPHAPKTRGRIVFETTCAQCHGTNLLGIGVAPPLRGLRHRLNDEAIINQVHNGKNGMPAHPNLTDDDLKALLDYLMLRDRLLPATPAKTERPTYNASGYPKFYDYEGYPANKPPWGTLNCIDLNTGKLLWKVPLGEYPELTAQGVKITGTENYGGAIVTAGGLVFCSGTRDHKIRAFDKDTGAELWSAKLPWVGNAPPASYQVNGRQYIVIVATGGNKLGTPYGDAYVAFALPRN